MFPYICTFTFHIDDTKMLIFEIDHRFHLLVACHFINTLFGTISKHLFPRYQAGVASYQSIATIWLAALAIISARRRLSFFFISVLASYCLMLAVKLHYFDFIWLPTSRWCQYEYAIGLHDLKCNMAFLSLKCVSLALFTWNMIWLPLSNFTLLQMTIYRISNVLMTCPLSRAPLPRPKTFSMPSVPFGLYHDIKIDVPDSLR